MVNISGCFVLGIVTGLGLYHGLSPTVRLVIGTGGMGAYTTFSTFTFETVRLAEEGAVDEAVRNVGGTFVVGLAAAAAAWRSPPRSDGTDGAQPHLADQVVHRLNAEFPRT